MDSKIGFPGPEPKKQQNSRSAAAILSGGKRGIRSAEHSRDDR